MLKRLPILFRNLLYNLKGGFLVRPLIIALGLGLVGGVLSSMEEEIPGLSNWAPKFLFPTHADPTVAQVILGGIAAAMMTVVSIVFAILLMTLTLASMQFSPRIIVSFSQDKVTQYTLGIFLGTFTYCLAALPSAHTLPQPFEPVLTVLGAMLLSLACVAWLLYFIHHISQAISVNHIIDRIATETEAMIDETMPHPIRQGRLATTTLHAHSQLKPSGLEAPVLSVVSGYVRYIDTRRLVAVSLSSRVTVRVLRRVGHFVPAGIPLLMVSKGEKVSEHVAAEFRAAFDIGPTRTLQQDVEYGILQIVDIALKAISPAVNDPSTGIGCVDQLSRILIRFATREIPESVLYDPPGVVRVSLPWLSFDRVVEAAFEQIRLYSQSDVAVSLRMLRALTDIATTIPDQSSRRTLVERGQKIIDGCAEHLGEGEMSELRVRMAVLTGLLPETYHLVPRSSSQGSP